MRILVVDDEADLREILQFNLENEGYQVDVASSAEEALDILTPNHDLILLDVMMGGMNGYRMAEKIRKEYLNNTPIIFLTARTHENDLLTGFSVGGDDYMTKPFSIKELLVRVKAILKRSSKNETPKTLITIGNLTIDPERKEAKIDSKTIVLTRKEFEILLLLALSHGRYLTRDSILGSAWGDVFVAERTIDVHITNLRKKLSDSSVTIISRTNYGYALENR